MGNGVNGTTILRSSASPKNASPEVTNSGTHTKLGGSRRTVFVQVGTALGRPKINPSSNANATVERKVAIGKPKVPTARFLTGNVPQLNADQLMLSRFILAAELDRITTEGATVNPLLVETIDAIDVALEAQNAAAVQSEPNQAPQRRQRVNADGGGRMSGISPRSVQRAAPTPEPPASVDAE